MKLVVTGALGHNGSWLIHALTPREVTEVVLIDNLSTQRYCSLFNLPAGVAWPRRTSGRLDSPTGWK